MSGEWRMSILLEAYRCMHFSESHPANYQQAVNRYRETNNATAAAYNNVRGPMANNYDDLNIGPSDSVSEIAESPYKRRSCTAPNKKLHSSRSMTSSCMHNGPKCKDRVFAPPNNFPPTTTSPSQNYGQHNDGMQRLPYNGNNRVDLSNSDGYTRPMKGYQTERNRNQAEIKAKCYPPRPISNFDCPSQRPWQNARYVRDDCGSGILPRRLRFETIREYWCRTPVTSYQASHGELARQILCGETVVQRSIESGPPCNICEYILPMCRGYYRKYECYPATCKKDCASHKHKPRDRVTRYWEPCYTTNMKSLDNFESIEKLRKYTGKDAGKNGDPCW